MLKYLKEIDEMVSLVVNTGVSFTKPIGQILLDYGFKLTSISQLEKHFRVEEINKVLLEKAKKEANSFAEEFNRSENLKAEEGFSFFKKRGAKKEASVYDYVLNSSVAVGIFKEREAVDTKFFRYSECTIKGIPLEHYLFDKIPNHCLLAVDKAKKAGVEDFVVFYPVIEEAKQKDPVIVGLLGNQMIEVAWWE